MWERGLNGGLMSKRLIARRGRMKARKESIKIIRIVTNKVQTEFIILIMISGVDLNLR